MLYLREWRFDIEILDKNNAKEHYMYPMFKNSLGGIYGEAFIYDKTEKYLTKKERIEYKKCALNNLYYAYYFKKQKYHETISSIATSQYNLTCFLSELGYNWIALFYEQKAMTVRQSINNDDGSELLNLASSLLRLGIIYAESPCSSYCAADRGPVFPACPHMFPQNCAGETANLRPE